MASRLVRRLQSVLGGGFIMNRILAAVAILGASSALAGCAPAGAPGDEGGEKSSRSGAALGGDDAVSRAMEWVSASMPYCGAPNHRYDGLLCYTTCDRSGAADDPRWDAYRSDCSGLVSWAWGLSAPGAVTWGLDDMTSAIPTSSLAPGDILLTDGHVVLFAGWTDYGAGSATIIHEGDCGQVAKTLPVKVPVGDGSAFTLWGSKYVAKRWDGLTPGSGGGAGTPPADDCKGVDYIGYCDGSTVVWCEGGRLRQKDCNDSGRSCDYQDDQTGYNCL
jgi:hypothetical protein